MPQFTWLSLIDRARTYVDDDHDDQQWIQPAQWLNFGNVEFSQLRRRWVRSGLMSPAPLDHAFTGSTTEVTGVLVVVGVAQDLGNGEYRLLSPAQPEGGRSPFWTRYAGTSCFWEAHGENEDLTFSLEPRDESGNYFVRYIPMLPYATLETDTVFIPDGGDERLVLGMARRAHVKDSGASRQIENLISLQDAEINMQAFGRGNGPRVRVTTNTNTFPAAPGRWYWR